MRYLRISTMLVLLLGGSACVPERPLVPSVASVPTPSVMSCSRTIDPETGEAPLVVELRIVESASWLRVTVDGIIRMEQIRQPGWSQRFTAQCEIRVRAGNSRDVEVIVNNGAPQRMGTRPGQMREQIFTAP